MRIGFFVGDTTLYYKR